PICLGDLYLCRVEHDREAGDPTELGFDAAVEFQPQFADLGPAQRRSPVERAARRLHLTNQAYRRHRIYDYGAMVDRMLRRPPVPYQRYPCVTPGWDNTARRRRQGVIVAGSTPQEYERWLRAVVDDFTPFGPDEDL